jgi:hypothetical protein
MPGYRLLDDAAGTWSKLCMRAWKSEARLAAFFLFDRASDNFPARLAALFGARFPFAVGAVASGQAAETMMGAFGAPAVGMMLFSGMLAMRVMGAAGAAAERAIAARTLAVRMVSAAGTMALGMMGTARTMGIACPKGRIPTEHKIGHFCLIRHLRFSSPLSDSILMYTRPEGLVLVTGVILAKIGR